MWASPVVLADGSTSDKLLLAAWTVGLVVVATALKLAVNRHFERKRARMSRLDDIRCSAQSVADLAAAVEADPRDEAAVAELLAAMRNSVWLPPDHGAETLEAASASGDDRQVGEFATTVRLDALAAIGTVFEHTRSEVRTWRFVPMMWWAMNGSPTGRLRDKKDDRDQDADRRG